MRHLLLFILALVLLAGCSPRTNRLLTEPAPPVTVTAAPPVTLQGSDSTAINKKNASLHQAKTGNTGLLSGISRIFSKPGNRKNVSLHQVNPGKQKFKNVVINQVVGDGNNLSNAGKKSDGPTAQAAPAATVQQATSEKGPAAAAGNDLHQTVPVHEAPGWKAVLAKYGFWVLLVLVVVGLGYIGYNRWRANQVKKLLG